MFTKKIILSFFSITMVAVLMGAGTFAAFSSSASNNNNSFGSGTLTLDVLVGGNSVTPAFNISDAKPGDIFTQVITLKNNGTIPASSTKLSNITINSSSAVNLGDALNLELWNDDGNGILDGGDTLVGSAVVTSGAWSNIPLGFGLAASGGTHQIIAKVTFADADNSYQNTNVNFNFNFAANQ